MARPAVFFDRDNTLIVSDGYLGDPEKVVLIRGAAAAVARARALGFARVIFSNQSGVARGMFDEQAVHAVNARLDEMLIEENPRAIIDRHEFCPFHPEAVVEQYRKQSTLRKPNPGMILQAASALALDLANSWVIGDAPRDIEAGKTAGCRTILFCDPTLAASPAATAASGVSPDFRVESLAGAMDVIEKSLSKAAAAVVGSDISRVETLLEKILERQGEERVEGAQSFSMTRFAAGIVQIVALAVWVMAYAVSPTAKWTYFCSAILLELFTIALLLMGRGN